MKEVVRVSHKADAKEEDRQGRFWCLRTKLIIYFVVLFTAVFVATEAMIIWGVPFTALSGRREQRRAEIFRQLSQVADLKKERLGRWLEERRDDTQVTARNELVMENVSRSVRRFHDYLEAGSLPSDFWTQVQKEESFRALVRLFETVMRTYGVYEDIKVIDMKTGTTIVSTDHVDLGKNVSERGYFSLVAGGCMEYVSDVAISTPEDAPTLRFAHTISNRGGEPIALLVMRVNIDDMVGPVLHAGAALGRTGETLLVNRDVKIITSLKHPLVDGSIARPLKYRIRAKPAVRAANGKEGIIESLDYRGEKVLAAYRYIMINPEVGWGMVVKADRSEIFAALEREEASFLLVGILGIMLLVVITVVVAGRITRPIQILSSVANRVAEGDLEARAPVETLDEIGLMAKTFNSMVERVQNWRQELESAVKERTIDLDRANENLRQEIVDRKRAEEIQSIQFRISEAANISRDLNEVFITIREQLGRLIDTNNISIALYHEEKDLYSFPFYIDEYDGADDVSPQRLPNSLTDYVRKTGEPLIVDRDLDARMRKEGKTGLVGTPSAIWLGVPLRTVEGVIGVLAVQHYTDPFRYTEKDLDLLTFVSGDVAMAIQRKQAEEKLKFSQFTIDHSTESMFWIEPDGSIVQASDHACKELGYSQEELLSMTIHYISQSSPKELFEDRWKEVARRGSNTLESVHRTKQGREFPVEMFTSYFRYEEREYIFVVARDITERKRVERMKDEFVSTVSHELRTPLTSIHGSIDLINRGKAGDLPEKARYLLEIAERNSFRLRELIENLLDIQKMEAGKIEFDMRPLDLKSVIEASLENNKSFGEQFDIEFVLDDDLPDAKVNADAARLKQVMDNFLSNAAKFSPAYSSVEVSVRRHQERIRVAVSDHGPGIAVEFRDKIFQKFSQADSSRTRKVGGTGLGLNIAKSIVERHGGRIGFETELNEGTTFYFELPEWIDKGEG